MTSIDAPVHAVPRPVAAGPPPRRRTMPDPRVAELLGARRRRISLIRGRVLALAVALFLAISAGITVQLVTGHDPALAGAAARTAGGGSTGTSRPGGSASGSQGTSSGSQNSSSGSISPVSTSSS